MYRTHTPTHAHTCWTVSQFEADWCLCAFGLCVYVERSFWRELCLWNVNGFAPICRSAKVVRTQSLSAC